MSADEEQRESASRRALALVVLAWLVLSAGATYQGLTRAGRLGYGSPDDAIALQALWNTTQGRPFRASLEGRAAPYEGNTLAVHFDVSQVLVLPAFWLAPGREVLLVLHPLLGLAGVLPLFFLARRRLGSPWRAACVACVHLLFPLLLANSIRLGLYYWLTPPLILLALERLDAGRLGWSAAAFGLAALTREEVAFGIAAFLLPMARSPERRRFCLLVALGCLGWSLGYLSLVGPPAASGGAFAARYGHLGDSLPALALSPLTRPGAFFSHLLSSRALLVGLLLLLPWGPAVFLAPRHLLAAAAPWLMVALSARPSDQVLGHYLVPAVPFLSAGLVEGARRLSESRRLTPLRRRKAGRAALAAAGALTFLAWSVDWGVFAHYRAARVLSPVHLDTLAGLTPESAQLVAALDAIPPSASVSASPSVLILLAQRRWLHPFPVRADDADVVVVDTGVGPASPRWPHSTPEQHQASIRGLLGGQGRERFIGRFLIIDRRVR